MKLKPIPTNTVVHTPTEEEAKELLAILHENGYKWYCSDKEEGWENFGNETCYRINSRDNVYYACDREWYETICEYCILPVLTLTDFKERYCEEEKPQPKFKVGDKVYQTSGYCRLDKYTVKKAYMDERGHWLYDLQGLIGIIGVEENNLCFTNQNPYTKLETKPTEDMETKEEKSEIPINLCELLKRHHGTIYSVVHDADVEFKLANGYIELMGIEYYSNGSMYDVAGRCLLYPSRALYEQYPLDPYTAWMKWQEGQRTYEIKVSIDYCENFMGLVDDFMLTFRTPADRDKCIEEIKAIIEKYSK